MRIYKIEKKLPTTSIYAQIRKTQKKKPPLTQKLIFQVALFSTMSSSYPGNIPKWLEDNKTFATEVFPSLPQPWHMDQRRFLAKESGKATLVRKSLPPKIPYIV